MKGTKFIWYTGKFVKWEKAKTHVLTHALHYGTGIFEGIRCYPSKTGGLLFSLNEHINRFFNSAATLKMRLPFSRIQLRRAVVDTVKKNGAFNVYVRPFAFYGYKKIGPNPADSPVEIIIACIPLKGYLPRDFIKVGISKFRRIPPFSGTPHAKISGMYFNSALATLEAAGRGCDEAIVLDVHGKVAEGAAENIFIVKKGKLYTPPGDTILPGITRGTVFSLAKDLKIKCIEKRISVADLKNADEAFFTGTAVEIHSIGSVDGKKLPRTNPITKKLQQYYRKIVRGGILRYRKLLQKV